MAIPKTRGQAIAAKCRECIHDDLAAGTWRQQVTACPVTDCALWTFRPLAGGIPDYLSTRDAARLPVAWRTMPHETAMTMIAGKRPASADGCAVQPIGDASWGNNGVTVQQDCRLSENGASSLPVGTA